MQKEIILMDYAGRKKTFTIDNFENVVKINITVVTGDEIATILRENYDEERFSMYSADQAYFDYEYVLYDKIKHINMIENNKWTGRKSSYSLENL